MVYEVELSSGSGSGLRLRLSYVGCLEPSVSATASCAD